MNSATPIPRQFENFDLRDIMDKRNTRTDLSDISTDSIAEMSKDDLKDIIIAMQARLLNDTINEDHPNYVHPNSYEAIHRMDRKKSLGAEFNLKNMAWWERAIIIGLVVPFVISVILYAAGVI